MPDDGSRQKEAYARFGLAMYRAQVFEHGLANAITLSTLVLSNESDIKQEQIDAILDDLFTHTAGKLLRRLRQVLDMSDQDADLIRRAINVRNRLVPRV